MTAQSKHERPARLCVADDCRREFRPTHGRQIYCTPQCSGRAYWQRTHPGAKEAVTVICKDARTDLSDFFKLSGCLEFKKLPHHPFIAFLPIDSGGTEVRLCDSISKLMELPDSTPVLAQWGGQWRSDFFSFTVRDAREAWLARDAK